MSELTYRAIRFYADGRPSEVIKEGLTLEEVSAHCEEHSGDGWFDGRECENPTDEMQEERIARDAKWAGIINHVKEIGL